MSFKLVRSAGLIGLATMASRILGVARETVLAGLFGARTQMDAYNVAFRIPNLLRDLFAEGAMTAAFVPTFTRVLSQRGPEAAWRVGSLTINALVLITGVLVLAGMVFAPGLSRAFAPQYALIPGKLELTTSLTRVMMPFLTTIAVAVAMMGMLNSLGRFFVPALAPAMFNVATIGSAFLLVPLMVALGFAPITAIAIGTLLGGLGQIVVQWPVLRKEGFRYTPVVDFRDPDLRNVLRLMVPATFGLATVQINLFVNTYLATSQEEGALSWLNYAFRLMYLPIGIFGASIATAALPAISRSASDADMDSMRATISGATRLMLMLNVPATFGLMVLAEPIVSLILERGAFTAADTMATAAALVFYAPGLIGYSAVKIASPSFYSLGDSRTPVAVGAGSVAANLVLNVVLVRVMGFRGLALGTAAAALVNAGLLMWLLERRLEGLDGRRIAVAFAKILGASVGMAIAVRAVSIWLGTHLPDRPHTLWAGVHVFASIATGVVVLAALARALRIAEFDDAFKRVVGRITGAGRTA